MDLSSEEEVKKALKCNREYMGKGMLGISEVVPVLTCYTGPGDPAQSPRSLPLEGLFKHRKVMGKVGGDAIHLNGV